MRWWSAPLVRRAIAAQALAAALSLGCGAQPAMVVTERVVLERPVLAPEVRVMDYVVEPAGAAADRVAARVIARTQCVREVSFERVLERTRKHSVNPLRGCVTVSAGIVAVVLSGFAISLPLMLNNPDGGGGVVVVGLGALAIAVPLGVFAGFRLPELSDHSAVVYRLEPAMGRVRDARDCGLTPAAGVTATLHLPTGPLDAVADAAGICQFLVNTEMRVLWTAPAKVTVSGLSIGLLPPPVVAAAPTAPVREVAP